MRNDENPEDAELTPGQRIYDQICKTYPFLTVEERIRFETTVSGINTANPVDGAQRLIQALNNPHAQIKKVKPENLNAPPKAHKLSPEKQPSYEIIDEVLVIKIPSWNRDVEDKYLRDTLLDNIRGVHGVVIDLRENEGGSSNKAYKFARNFLPKGVHTFGTYLSNNGTGDGLETFPATVDSETKNPIKKPVVILTSNKTFSAGEHFVAAMKTLPNCTVIGEETGGGIAYAEEFVFKIGQDDYSVKIPTRRLILNGKNSPIEETRIQPDIPYEGEDIVDFAVKHVKEHKRQESYPFAEVPGIELGRGYVSIVKALGPGWVVKEFNPNEPDGTPKGAKREARVQQQSYIRDLQETQRLLMQEFIYGDKLIPTYWILGSDDHGNDKYFTVQRRFGGKSLGEVLDEGDTLIKYYDRFINYFRNNPSLRKQMLELVWGTERAFLETGVFDDFHIGNIAVVSNEQGQLKLKLFDIQNILSNKRILYLDPKASESSKLNVLKNIKLHSERIQKFKKWLDVTEEEEMNLNNRYGVNRDQYETAINQLAQYREQLEQKQAQ